MAGFHPVLCGLMVSLVLIHVAMYSNFLISSVNVNGLRQEVKRSRISESCGSDILLLQETHASGFFEARAWARKFGCAGFWSFGSRSSCGTAILLSKKHPWRPTDYFRDNAGRLVSVTITLPSTKSRVRIINCYAPTNRTERQRFLKNNSLYISKA